MKKLIKHIIKEEVNKKERFINTIENVGLYTFLTASGLSYEQLSNLIGEEYLTRKLTLKFINEVINNFAGGYLSLFNDHDKFHPIPLSRKDDLYSEIIALRNNYAVVTVIDVKKNEHMADYNLVYHALEDDVIKEMFNVTTKIYDEEIL